MVDIKLIWNESSDHRDFASRLIKEAYRLYPTPCGHRPTIVFDIDGYRLFGQAWKLQNKIRMNTKFTISKSEFTDMDVDFFAEVLLHEYAHLIAPNGAHHGPEFKKWAARLDAKFGTKINTHVGNEFDSCPIMQKALGERKARYENKRNRERLSPDKRTQKVTHYIWVRSKDILFARSRKPKHNNWWYGRGPKKERCEVITAEYAEEYGLLVTCEIR